MRLLRHRPSPALIIACLALFAALGGTAYAAIKITGANVRDRTLTYHDIKQESLGTGEIQRLRGRDIRTAAIGGTQVDEKSLGTVPSAASAGGLFPRKVFAKVPTNGAETTVLNLGGVSLLASCPSGTVQVRAISSSSDTEFAAQAIANNNTARGVRAGDLDIGESVDVDQGIANGHVSLSYANGGGTTVTADLGLGSTSSFGGTSPGCSVYGTALGG